MFAGPRIFVDHASECSIKRLWLQQVVDEEATIQALVNMARRKQIEREANMAGGGGIKKPRFIGSKPGPKAMR